MRRQFSTILLAGLLATLLTASSGCSPRTPRSERAAARISTDGGPGATDRDAELQAAELDVQKQQAIWDGEHVTFAIEKRLGTSFLKALADREPAAVGCFFRPQCRAEILSGGSPRLRKSGPVSERLATAAEIDVEPVGLDRLIAALVEPLMPFEKIERSRFRVLEIGRLSRQDAWRARVLMTFVGKALAGGLVLYESHHEIELTIADDRQLASEPSIDRWRIESELHRESSRKLMEEVTVAAGLAEAPIPDNWTLPVKETEQYRFQVAVEDFDRDGDLDIAVAAIGAQPVLLASDAGRTYHNVSRPLGLVERRPMENFAAAWIDYDNDGFPDLVMGDRLYRNERGRKFVDVTQQAGLFFAKECMGCLVGDYDADGRLDLYALYQRDWNGPPAARQRWVDEGETGKSNTLWRNIGHGRFRDVTAASGAGGGKRHSHAAAWFFYDEDHWPDLYIANDFGKNVVLRNRGDGTFEDISDPSRAADYATSMGVAAGDLNNDSISEIYVANMYSKMGRRIIGQLCDDDYPAGLFAQIQGSCAGNRLYSRRRSESEFNEFAEAAGVSHVGWAFAPAMADLDNDGLLDLYATTGFMSFERGKPDG